MILTNKIKTFTKSLNLSIFYQYTKISYYEALQIDPGASSQQIKTKYYALAKQYHPDVAKDEMSTKKFINIQQAYQTLGNDTKRKEYDKTYYAQTYGNYDKERQNYYYQPPKYGHHSYYRYSQTHQHHEHPSFFKLLLENKFKIISYGIALYFILELLNYFQFKQCALDIENQQKLTIHHNPHAIERRKKMYKEEMQKKNIYGQIRQVKMRRLEDEGQKAKKEKIESIKSIKGIQKFQDPQNLIAIKAQYI